MAFPIAAVLAAGTDILGGALGAREGNKARDAAATNFGQQLKFQEDLAQFGIRWRVDDAKAAGIHPLAALGANLTNYSPIPMSFGADNSWSDALSSAGQNIGRAVEATMSERERLATVAKQNAVQDAQLEESKARTELYRAQALEAIHATNPPFPTQVAGIIQGQGNSSPTNGDAWKTVTPPGGGAVTSEVVPAQITAGNPNKPHVIDGAEPDVQYIRTATGYAVSIPQKLSESFENDTLGAWSWQWRNRLKNMIPGYDDGPPIKLRPGYKWTFNPFMGEYRVTTDGVWAKEVGDNWENYVERR